jgi:hypothetical protein
MTLISAFEIGIWNAWILMLIFMLVTGLILLIMMKRDALGGPSRVPCKSKPALLIATLSKVIYLPLLYVPFSYH